MNKMYCNKIWLMYDIWFILNIFLSSEINSM